MENSIVEMARKYLIEYLRGKENLYETIHPWRKGWEFAVQHCFRVEAYAEKIMQEEAPGISLRETELIRTAAILHDIGRLDSNEKKDAAMDNHAAIGAEVVRKWLTVSEVPMSEVERKQCISRISNHSKKEEMDEDFGSRVIKDADVLDEIGAMSIFMCSNWLDKSSPFFYQELLERINDFELEYCDKQYSKLSTGAAKKILSEKKSFIEAFKSQLQDELQGTLELKL